MSHLSGNKNHTKKYSKLPPKEADQESQLWKWLHVDLIGPYQFKHKHKILILHAIAMINPATSWFEVIRIPTNL